MTGLLICAAAFLAALGGFSFGYGFAAVLYLDFAAVAGTGLPGLALIAVALWLAYAAGGA